MKIASLALFFLLLTIAKADLVYDTEGEPLSKAHTYHVAIGKELGRSYFTLKNFWNMSCPLEAIAAPLTAETPPLPVKFSDNLTFPYPFAFTDIPLNFTFVGPIPRCYPVSQWFASRRFASTAWSLMFGYAESLTVEGDFIVQNYGEEYSYKIIFCPKESPENCRNLSLRYGFVDVADTDVSLEIRFERVHPGVSMVV